MNFLRKIFSVRHLAANLFHLSFMASIWAPGAIPVEEWKYRNSKRMLFPIIDVFFILGGFSAARFGIPAISEFFPDSVVDLFAYVLSVAGLVCLLGVSFPKFWPLEIGGKSLILALMVGYFTSLLILTSQGEDSRGFILLVAAIAIAPLVWRLSILASEWQERTVEKRHVRALLNEERNP